MRRPTLALLLGCLLLVAGVSALDGYAYYQTIEYAGCDQETYQQDIVIHHTTGTAYNETSGGLETWHIYVGEHCREDYGDVRFTNSTGAELAYYLWPDHDSSSARFTVRLEGADQSGALVIWYGNPTATTTSNGDQTFRFYDTFSGSALDEDRWNPIGTPSITVSNSVLKITGKEYAFSGIESDSSFTFPAIIECRESSYWGGGFDSSYYKYGWMKSPASNNVIGYYDGLTSRNMAYAEFGVTCGPSSQSALTALSKPRNIVVSAGSTIATSGVIYKDLRLIYASGDIRVLLDGEQLGATSAAPIPHESAPIGFACARTEYGPGDLYLDWIIVRAYSATPPAATSFSGEYPPTAAFTATPLAGLAPLTVQFTDTSTGSPTSWAWTFGDGNTSTAQNPQHTYTAPGLYTVTLNATNEYGSDTETKTDYITVYSPVTAQFMADVTYGALPLTVQFTDASSGSPTSWTWDFGDGNTSTDQNPEHTYTSTGTYTVKLIASHPYDSDEETKVNYITVVTLQPFPGCSSNPTDPDSDGLYEDINGNGRWDFQDLVLFFQHLTWCNANQPITLFDWNSNFRCDFDDVHKLWLDGGMI